ncbi:MAG: class I SAM-dependent methyltransferase [Fibrobacteres bacterium]|nr:class I SAM-dependent methyltransferase [Fibrobacterota bacterium]
MGTSNWQHISKSVEIIRQIGPKKVLDVGVGFGRWGMICREFLDVWENRVKMDQWETEIDGVEIFEANIASYHNLFYSKIHIGDAVDYVDKTDKHYDLIILGDMVEHLEKTRAYQFIECCLDKTDFVLLNIPIGQNWDQAEAYDNPHERHLSNWTIKDFNKFKPLKIFKFRDYIYRSHVVMILSRKHSKLPPNNLLRKLASFHLERYPKAKQLVKSIAEKFNLI